MKLKSHLVLLDHYIGESKNEPSILIEGSFRVLKYITVNIKKGH